MYFEDQNHLTSNFDNLLDMSSINNSITFHDISDKFGFSQKERTRQQSYQEISKQINQAKIEQAQLRHQLQIIKKSAFDDYLGRFQEQIDQLNHENQTLRKELKDVSCKKIEDKRQRMSNRSSIRPRTSVNSIIGDENRKTHTKTNRKNASPNMILKKKQAKLTESSAFLGRSQIHSPCHHKRRQSQLTQRKIEENNSEFISFNNSIDDKGDFNFTGSVSKQYLKPSQTQKNIFVQILQKMLKEQVALDHQKYAQIYLESTRPQVEIPKQDPIFINTIEKQIKQVNSKLQMLSLVANRYQSEIEEMNINIKSVSDIFDQLYAVKGKYVNMQIQCEKLGKLRKQVKEKEQVLANKRQQMEKQKDESKTITSIETLIKIFTNNPQKTFSMHHTQLYSTYYRQLKQLFKFDKQDQVKRQQKSVKVKELIDSIRNSRKKFNELIQIYEGRILKLEQKIARVLKMQSQSAKSSQK